MRPRSAPLLGGLGGERLGQPLIGGPDRVHPLDPGVGAAGIGEQSSGEQPLVERGQGGSHLLRLGHGAPTLPQRKASAINSASGSTA